MTNLKTIQRLLGLVAVLLIIPFANNAFAATATITSAQVTGPNQVTIVFSDPLDWVIGDFTDLNINAGARNVVSISETAPSSTVTITFDGAAVNTAATGDIDIAAIADGGSGNDFAGATDQVLSDGQSPPAPVLSYSGSNPTNSNPVSFSVDFGEDINAATFVDTDVSVSSGTVQNIVDSGDGQNFTFEVLGATNGATLSLQITGDVDDLAGNAVSTDSNIVNVSIDLDGPAITILGNNPESLAYGANYADAGATAFDVGDGDLTGSIVTTGLPIDTFSSGTYSVTYQVTDSNGNSAQAIRTVFVANKPAEGRSCGGDCYHPHLGVDQNNRVFYEDGLKINGVTYKISNVLHNHPDKVIELPVGQMVTMKAKVQDTFVDNIERCELSIGIPKGKFDKSLATFKIGINRSFDGQVTNYYEGDLEAFRDVDTSMVNEGNVVMCTWHFTPTKHLEHDMFAVEVMDSYRYTGTYYVNEGVTFRGISEVGTPVYDVMDNKGRLSTITIVDRTLENLNEAVDQDGNLWHLVNSMWAKDFIRPDMTCYTTDGTCASGHKALLLEQQEIAKKYFDSSAIQGELKPSFTYDFPDRLPRGEQAHKTASSICENLKTFLARNPDVVNHSSCKLE